MFRPSIGELLMIGLVVALIFGARRLPDLGRALGQAIKNFQRSVKGDDDSPPASGDK